MLPERLRLFLRRHPDWFLKELRGVIHVGANHGQERETYSKFGVDVIWIEPIPEVFSSLVKNISNFPRQRAIQALVTDRDGAQYTFNVSNNWGASSSILELDLHRDIWPDVAFERTLQLTGATLQSIVEREKIDINAYNGLVMDTQGSELLVLRGAEPLLAHFDFIKTEVPDFSSYTGCVLLPQMDEFMRERGFVQRSRHKFADHPSGGAYYDVIYGRVKRRR
jgi:FkbM family methyltransferase